MKTPINELIEAIMLIRKNNLSDRYISDYILKYKEQLLEKEKQMIINAVEDALIDEDGHDYYKRTFKK